MSTASKRLVEIDFFRGLALLVIAVDHITGSALARVTLHRFAACDTAEVFVFVGGFAAASAFRAIELRHGTAAAERRFFKRALEIYLAFLLTAALMVGVGFGCHLAGWHTPVLALTDWTEWFAHPATAVANVMTLRRQPYLSAILPMYALYALSIPFFASRARRAPLATLAGSLLIWAFAPALARLLPSADATGWSFNPFAWQLIYVLGALARSQNFSANFLRSRTALCLTVAAVVVVAVLAFAKLVLEVQPPAGYLKQNLAPLRVINFVALAWLAAHFVRTGLVGRLAARLPAVVMVGQHALVCFVCGSVISVLADTWVMELTHGAPRFVLSLGTDVCATAAMLAVARLAQFGKRTERRRQRVSAPAVTS